MWRPGIIQGQTIQESLLRTRGKQFKFELGWFLRDGFFDMVANIWNRKTKGANALRRWQNKIWVARQYLHGWAAHTAGMLKKKTLSSVPHR